MQYYLLHISHTKDFIMYFMYVSDVTENFVCGCPLICKAGSLISSAILREYNSENTKCGIQCKSIITVQISKSIER